MYTQYNKLRMLARLSRQCVYGMNDDAWWVYLQHIAKMDANCIPFRLNTKPFSIFHYFQPSNIILKQESNETSIHVGCESNHLLLTIGSVVVICSKDCLHIPLVDIKVIGINPQTFDHNV